MPEQYAVFGHPVSHSLSPLIHSLFAKQTNQQLEYIAIDAPINGFSQAITEFWTSGGKGANVTLPFKEEAFYIVTTNDFYAQQAKAVNTICFNGKEWQGYNTDGIGLIKDLQRQGVILKNQRVLVIGAGGVVRGILSPLLQQQPSQLVLANRTHEKAQQLAEEFAYLGNIFSATFEALDKPFDIVINGTSSSLLKQALPLPAGIIGKNTFCYDLAYSKDQTLFLQQMSNFGAKQLSDGLGMLVEQAAAAFHIWRGVYPETTTVLKHIREF